MRARAFACASVAAFLATVSIERPGAMGKPGVTPVPCPTQEWQTGDPAFEALAGARAFSGTYDGGLYRIEIPDTWNGELVLYAHGFVSNAGTNGSMLRVQNQPIREHLIKNGFAWAASSYRCNGYVPGQGLVDTMVLVDLFTQTNGGKAPQRTYLTGTSMGGHVTLLGMQEFPTSFAGGLAMCPAGPELFDYFAAVSAAAEVVTGVQFSRETLQQDAAKMADILGKPPDYTDKGRQLASIEIQISGGPRPFAMEGLASRFIPNMSTSHTALVGISTPGNRALTNTHIKYAIDAGLGLSADEINAKVRRKAADPEVRNPNGPYEEVVPFDGRIERPVLTMHGTGDLFVPVFLQQTLKRAVVAAGNERLLVQRLYRIAGHCQFSRPEQIRAFDDLVKWVRQGTKPEGDEVYGDLSDAGRTFTDPLRANDPGGLTVTTKSSSVQAAAQPVQIDFVRDVQPIFRASCIGCHGPAIHQNGLRLDRRRDAMRGGTGPVIGRGNSAGSRLYQMLIGSEFGPQMPPTGALTPDQIATIKAWIDQGAEWPDSAANDALPPPVNADAARAIEALRTGDLKSFKAIGAGRPGFGSLRGPDGDTPLMQAVLHGDVGLVRQLLDGGADPNARNDAGATALMWAAQDADKTRVLLEYGADPTARSDNGRTALLAAAGHAGAAPIVRMLLEYGADPSDAGPATNALFEAATTGDESIIRLLLDAGATVKRGYGIVDYALKMRCRTCAELLVKTMDPKTLDNAILLAAPPFGDARDLEFFLERGANVNAKDPAGRTLLMTTVSSDVAPPSAVKLLLDRGADVNAKSSQGETALALAKLRGRTAIVDLLVVVGAKDEGATAPRPAAAPASSARAAVERSLPLLQQSDVTFLKKSGCVSCHNNTLTAMSVAAARKSGIAVDENTARQQRAAIAAFLDSWRDRALQGMGIPGDADTVSYILAGLYAEQHKPDAATDAMARFLKRQQASDGSWRIVAHRPPIESDDVEVTALSMRMLQVYAPPNEREEYQRSVQRAAAWLNVAKPQNTEARAFQLLGVSWSGATRDRIRAVARTLVAEQRPDGGWAQLPTLESDAYATGQALVALAESGALNVNDPVYQRGVQFLLRTQLADGSWLVKSRAIPIQPLFESGFPHGRDQWISAAATNWATMALARAVAHKEPRS